MIVEVIGPAGSGKTTMLAALRLRDPSIVSAIATKRSQQAAALSAVLRAVLPHYARHPHAERFFSLEELRRAVYVEGWARRLGGPGAGEQLVTVLDHGPVFMLAMLRAFGPPSTRCRGYRAWEAAALKRWSKLLDVAVCLDASDEILVQRIEGRSRAHCVKGRPVEEACEFLRRCRTSFDRTLLELQRTGDLAVIRLKTDSLEPGSLAAIVGCALGLPEPPAVGHVESLRHAG